LRNRKIETIFLQKSYPFYKFGDIVPIRPIEIATWIPYIQQGFASEGFSKSEIRDLYNLGSYSNISRLKKAMEDAELTYNSKDGTFFADPILEAWFKLNF